MTTTIVVQSSESRQVSKIEKGRRISYHLSSDKKFSEPHFARIVWVKGPSNPCIFFADFVKPQEINGELKPFLGTSSSSDLWVPLASDYIRNFGFLEVFRSDGKALAIITQFTIVIEIAPLSWINGTKNEA